MKHKLEIIRNAHKTGSRRRRRLHVLLDSSKFHSSHSSWFSSILSCQACASWILAASSKPPHTPNLWNSPCTHSEVHIPSDFLEILNILVLRKKSEVQASAQTVIFFTTQYFDYLVFSCNNSIQRTLWAASQQQLSAHQVNFRVNKRGPSELMKRTAAIEEN